PRLPARSARARGSCGAQAVWCPRAWGVERGNRCWGDALGPARRCVDLLAFLSLPVLEQIARGAGWGCLLGIEAGGARIGKGSAPVITAEGGCHGEGAAQGGEEGVIVASASFTVALAHHGMSTEELAGGHEGQHGLLLFAQDPMLALLKVLLASALVLGGPLATPSTTRHPVAGFQALAVPLFGLDQLGQGTNPLRRPVLQPGGFEGLCMSVELCQPGRGLGDGHGGRCRQRIDEITQRHFKTPGKPTELAERRVLLVVFNSAHRRM